MAGGPGCHMSSQTVGPTSVFAVLEQEQIAARARSSGPRRRRRSSAGSACGRPPSPRRRRATAHALKRSRSKCGRRRARRSRAPRARSRASESARRAEEAGAQQQILGRVAGDGELGEEDEVAPRPAPRRSGGHQLAVAVEVADDRVDLREREPQGFRLSVENLVYLRWSSSSPARYNGPPGSANGGYTCGLLAEQIGEPAEVTLRLAAAARPADALRRHEAVDGEDARRRGARAHVHRRRAEPVAFYEAERASADYPGFEEHESATCFVCGPNRDDGLGLFAGAVDGSEASSPRRGSCRTTSAPSSSGRRSTAPARSASAGRPRRRCSAGWRRGARGPGAGAAVRRRRLAGRHEGRKGYAGTALYRGNDVLAAPVRPGSAAWPETAAAAKRPPRCRAVAAIGGRRSAAPLLPQRRRRIAFRSSAWICSTRGASSSGVVVLRVEVPPAERVERARRSTRTSCGATRAASTARRREAVVGHLGAHEARADREHGDPSLRAGSRASRRSVQRRLARAVRGLRQARQVGGAAAGDHDPAAAALEHPGDRGPARRYDAEHVHLVHAPPVLGSGPPTRAPPTARCPRCRRAGRSARARARSARTIRSTSACFVTSASTASPPISCATASTCARVRADDRDALRRAPARARRPRRCRARRP